MEKWPFFRAATAGLGKYHTGGYGRIGVYRVQNRWQWHTRGKNNIGNIVIIVTDLCTLSFCARAFTKVII